MSRLDRFINIDDVARDRSVKISAIVGFGWFFVSKTLLGVAGKAGGYSTIAVVFGVYLTCLWSYCRSRESVRVAATVALPGQHSLFAVQRRLAMAVATALAFVVVNAIPAPVVEAAVWDRKIRRLTRDKTLSPREAEDVADSLEIASQERIILPPETLVRSRDVIKESVMQGPTGEKLSRAANALAKYDEVVSPIERTSEAKALAAYYRGADHIRLLTSSFDPKELEAAISEYTTAIDLADGDKRLKSYALMERGGTYNITGRYSHALADAESAERLGNLNLFLLSTVEGQALVHLCRSREDLTRAGRLLSLALEMLPQTQRTSFFWLRARAEAYYGLGDFPKAIESYQQSLAMLPKKFNRGFLGTSFGTLCFSYLQLGNIDGALRASAELAERTSDPDAILMYRTLEESRSDPNVALMRLRQKFPTAEPCHRDH